MKIQKIQNCIFTEEQKSAKPAKKGKKFYKGFTGVVLGTGVCCLASDRLFKSPAKLPNKISKFGFWMTWLGIGLAGLGIATSIYKKSMEQKPES